jgi:hypothetical protein
MLSFVLSVLLAAPAAAPAPSSPGLSQAEAEAVARRLEGLPAAAAAKAGKVVRQVQITQSELNSYLNLALLPAVATAVRDVEVRIDRDHVDATGLVDIDEVKRHLKLSPWNPLSLLSGDVPVALSGKYTEAREGYGRVAIETVKAGRISVPASIIEQLVASLTKTPENPEGVDIKVPFQLPEPVKRLRLLPGKAVLDL